MATWLMPGPEDGALTWEEWMLDSRDIALLAGIAGDAVEFDRTTDLLTAKMQSVASSLFRSDAQTRDEAVEKAMDKIKDELHSQFIANASHPFIGARKIGTNYLISLARKRSTEGIALHANMPIGEIIETLGDGQVISYQSGKKAHVGPTVTEEMRWVDEGFAKLDTTDEEEWYDENAFHSDANETKTGASWRFFRITNEQPPTRADLEQFYQYHKWVEFLQSLLRYEWWWHPGYWRDKLREPMRRDGCLQTLGEAVRFKVKQGRERLWKQLDLTNALLDSITADRERLAVLYLLWNHPRQSDIAKIMGVSEPYVSKALRHVKEWGWTDDDVSLARLILLTHTLASWCRQSWKEIQRLDSSLAWWDEEAREWVFEEMDENKRQHMLAEEARIYDELYRRVTTRNETKAYFADLNRFDFGGANSHLGRPVHYAHESLTAVCSSLYGIWFGWRNFET